MRALAQHRLLYLALILATCLLLLIVITTRQMSLAVAPSGATPGVHFGNVKENGDRWDSMYFSRINGQGGRWPGVEVVMSNQVYEIERAPEPDCRIQAVSVPTDVSHQAVWSYVQQASARHIPIIIRIMPSGGYFDDGHRLITDTLGVDYCDWPNRRSVPDVGDEIVKIHDFNQDHGVTEFGFVPANEPNTEWYEPPGPGGIAPIRRNDPLAWKDMDAFFAAIWDYVHEQRPNEANLRVFTPPMAQNAFAETYKVLFGSMPERCRKMFLIDGTNGGYWLMNRLMLTPPPYTDGYTWNNYWVRSYESWSHCKSNQPGQHVAFYFPGPMQTRVADPTKVGIITEADLASPTQQFGNPLNNKDEDAGREAVRSLNAFLPQEKLGDYAAVWNLNVSDDGEVEQNWHEAYENNPTIVPTPGKCERVWFSTWWDGQGAGVPTCTVWPTYTPTPSSPGPAPTKTPTPTPKPTQTPTPTPTPTPTYTPTPLPTPLLTNFYDYPDPFSPNNDGWQDETFLHYTLHQTATAQVIVQAPDECYLNRTLWSGEQPLGEQFAAWDGCLSRNPHPPHPCPTGVLAACPPAADGLFVGGRGCYSQPYRLYRSADWGDTWQDLSAGLPEYNGVRIVLTALLRP